MRMYGMHVAYIISSAVNTIYKIHLWRHSIVLALHYFQGMACYRSATLLEVMDTRSFWNMFVFSRVMYRQSWIPEEHSNNSCFSMNKKKVGGDSSSRTHARIKYLGTVWFISGQ